MKAHLQDLILKSLTTLVAEGVLSELPKTIRLDHKTEKSRGDFASNIALVLSKQAGLAPRQLAEQIIKNLPVRDTLIKAEIAGAGFINFFLAADLNSAIIAKIIQQGVDFGRNKSGKGVRILLEFVSANPTGPLHIGHGRGAAYGATVANLLRAVGFSVDCEYYVNDAGRQMDILTTSVYLRYISSDKFPANCYQGDYITKMAKQISAVKKFDVFAKLSNAEQNTDSEKQLDALIKHCKNGLNDDYKKIADLAINTILDGIKKDLSDFGVEYQQWFSERSLAKNNITENAIEKLQKSGNIYPKNGALWFKTTAFNDEKDRVVVRDNGAYTYFASDIGYHAQKFERGYDKIINIWGADHHGYIARVQAAVTALGFDADKLEILLVQFANLLRGGKKITMSTRSGSFATLEQLRTEIGNDATRFFYILRKSEQHLDFDLDLATSKTNKNPIFYIQYAYARICSVLVKAEETKQNTPFDVTTIDFSLLNNDYEIRIIKQLNRYQSVLQNCAINYEPHILAYYLRDLSADLHSYYNSCEFLVKDQTLQSARLSLIIAVAQILKNALNLLGVSAPDKM